MLPDSLCSEAVYLFTYHHEGLHVVDVLTLPHRVCEEFLYFRSQYLGQLKKDR